MHRAHFPILFQCSHAVRAKLGRDVDLAVVLVMKAVLVRHGRLDVAHQQIVFRNLHLAFSTRIGRGGDLFVDIDEGDPALADRIVLESELRQAERRSREAGACAGQRPSRRRP